MLLDSYKYGDQVQWKCTRQRTTTNNKSANLAIFNNYSSSPNGLSVKRPDSEAMRARGIIVLVKSNWLVKNIENKKNLAS